jgi:3',5'-cyclic AMP phosphodiesterase CpdA
LRYALRSGIAGETIAFAVSTKAYAMKIVQVTDTHLVGAGQSVYGIDPRARLDACFADINARHGDAAFCVLSGDLTDRGEAGAYRELRHALSALRVPYHVMIGNHDSRQTLLEVLPETPADPNGFLQCALDTPAGRVLLLDTVEAGRHAGAYCEARADWLAARLDEAGDGPVYIFMHHPPFDIGIPSLDRIRLADPAAFVRAIEGRRNLRHIFFGHVHRPVSGSWRGIPFSALRGTAHQVALDLHTESPIPKTREPPAYAVILLAAERTVVHLHDYLDHSPIDGAASPPPPE